MKTETLNSYKINFTEAKQIMSLWCSVYKLSVRLSGKYSWLTNSAISWVQFLKAYTFTTFQPSFKNCSHVNEPIAQSRQYRSQYPTI